MLFTGICGKCGREYPDHARSSFGFSVTLCRSCSQRIAREAEERRAMDRDRVAPPSPGDWGSLPSEGWDL